MSADLYKDKEWLEKKYIDEHFTQTEIANFCGVSVSTIYNKMKYLGISVRKKLDATAEELQKLYWKDGLSLIDIAKMYDCSDITVQKTMDKLGIPTRTRSEAAKNAWKHEKHEYLYEPVNITRKELVDLYCVDELSTIAIAKKFNCSSTTIKRKMDMFGIPARDLSSAAYLVGRAGVPQGHRIETDDELIVKEYTENNKTITQIAKMCGCSHDVINRRLTEKGIKLRTYEEYIELSKKRFIEWNLEMRDWQPLFPYPSEWNNEFKEKIRQRDNYKCAICRHYGKTVHHIDYDKRNMNENNFIVLCKNCHPGTNYHREYWKEEFSRIICARGYS